MENQSNKSEEQKTKENSRSKKYSKRRVLKAFYYVFVVSGLSVSVYLGYKYLENIKEDVSSTQRTVVETKEKVANIEQLSNMNNSRLDVLTSQGSYQNYSMPIPIFANLTVEKVLEDKNSALEDGFRFIILDIKLENKTQNDIYFNAMELKLKDAENYEYNFYGYMNSEDADFVKKDSKVLFPDNRLPLSYSLMKPGEPIKGSVIFVVNRPGTKFTLIRNGETLKNISL